MWTTWFVMPLIVSNLGATDKLNTYVRVVMLDFSKAFDLIRHSVLHPLLLVANVPCKFRFSAALFIRSYRLEPVHSIISSTHVRLGFPLPRLPSSLPSIVVSRVS